MKIVNSPQPRYEPDDEPRHTPPAIPPAPVLGQPAPHEEIDLHLDQALIEFKKQILGDLQQLLDRYESARSQGENQVKQNGRSLESLAADLTSMRDLIAKGEAARARGEEQVKITAKGIEHLTEEMAALRQALIEFKAEHPASPRPPRKDPPGVIEFNEAPAAPAPQPVEMPQEPEPEPRRFLDALAGETQVEPEQPKVAFIQKLWDYLNQTAFEIPLHKSDRPG